MSQLGAVGRQLVLLPEREMLNLNELMMLPISSWTMTQRMAMTRAMAKALGRKLR